MIIQCLEMRENARREIPRVDSGDCSWREYDWVFVYAIVEGASGSATTEPHIYSTLDYAK